MPSETLSRYQRDPLYREKIKARSAARYASQTPEARREYLRRLKYGISQAEIDAMLKAQSGRCAICETDDPGQKRNGHKTWSVDHDHRTGKVRGILCALCNLVLGAARDDEHKLFAAAEYLIESKRNPRRSTCR